MDLEIREFSQAIVNFINKSPLPAEIKRLALRDICTKLEAAADGEIQRQIAERERAEKEKAEREKEEAETAKTTDEETEQQGLTKFAKKWKGKAQERHEAEEREIENVEALLDAPIGGGGDE